MYPANSRPPKKASWTWSSLLERDMLQKNGTWDLLKIDDLLNDFKDLSLLQISERWHQGAFKISLHPLVAEWIK